MRPCVLLLKSSHQAFWLPVGICGYVTCRCSICLSYVVPATVFTLYSMYVVNQWPPTFWALGTSSMEKSFSVDQRRGGLACRSPVPSPRAGGWRPLLQVTPALVSFGYGTFTQFLLKVIWRDFVGFCSTVIASGCSSLLVVLEMFLIFCRGALSFS